MRAEQAAFPITAPRPRLVARLARALAESWRVWNNRRTVRRLNELSDWELLDIGLERDDIALAFEGPVFDDPTRRLQQIARARARTEAIIRRRP